MTVSSTTLDNMDQDVTKKLKGLDGHAYVSPKGNSGHLALEATKRYVELKLIKLYL